jgi:hypothetical protein
MSQKTMTIIARRVRLWRCAADSPFGFFAGTVARPGVVFALVAAIAGGLLLGYLGAPTVEVHSAPPLNLSAPTINTAAPSADRNWEVLFLGRPMSYYQQYTCDKFGPACRVALAIQAAENLKGDCEAFHYNADGTLDWGYFQINTVHLTRRGVRLRDLLDCKANIDFAYQLYTEEGFRPWSTFTGGQYEKFLEYSLRDGPADRRAQHNPESLLRPAGLASR